MDRTSKKNEALTICLKLDYFAVTEFIKVVEGINKMHRTIVSVFNNIFIFPEYSDKALKNILLIESIETGNSVTIRFKEAWLQGFGIDKSNVLIEIPEYTGILAIIECILISTINKTHSSNNRTLEGKKKEFEFQLKENKLGKVIFNTICQSEIKKDLDNQAVEIVKQAENTVLKTFSVNDIDLINYNLKNEVTINNLKNKDSINNIKNKETINKVFLEKSEEVIRQLEKNMVTIPAGTFLMGDESINNAKPVHTVTLDSFEIGGMLVTNEQYEAVMGINPSLVKGNNYPVTNVSGDDAQMFCEKLTQKTGTMYKLPTEAQWEYACRAGSKGSYFSGEDENELKEYAWYTDNSNLSSQPVGKKKPNTFGLYDMHGNVWEWCSDWYDDYKDDFVMNPEGPKKGVSRVLRGGSWNFLAGYSRSAFRLRYVPGYRDFNIGFRLSRGRCVQGA